ncbi:MAG: multicopper oxidase domain-containing protein [Lautropia sp.]|nr:multicopper oxidase domain-containing protein [Lautropia sp.]
MPQNHPFMKETGQQVFKLSRIGQLSVLLAGALGMHAGVQAQSVQTYQTLQNPPVFTAQDNVASTSTAPAGVRASGTEAVLPPARQQSVRLNVEYSSTYIWNPVSGKYDRVRLRSYHGRSGMPPVAPTINIQPGTRLNIRLNNKLPVDDPSCQNREGADHNIPNCFNSTNLHTHGLWVDPNGISDNIFLTVKPGQTQRYAIDIPSDHPAGTFWYHSHLHGSTALQVSSGMAGALIVRGNRQPTASRPGDLDTLLRPNARHRVQERVLVMQQIQYSCRNADGTIKEETPGGLWKCDDGDVGGIENYDAFRGGSWARSGRFTTINGQTLPTFTGARSGRFERWRMIHAGVRETINLQFRQARVRWNQALPDLSRMRPEQLRRFVNDFCTGAPLPQHLVAADGLTMNNVLSTTATTFQPGYRWDSVMVFPRAGYYCVMDSASPGSGSVNGVPVQQLLGIVAVEPGAVQMRDDQIPAFFKREMVQLAVRNVSRSMRRKVAAGLQSSLSLAHYAPHKTISRSELTEPTENVTFNIARQEGGGFSFQVDGKPYDPNVMGRLLKLGGVQEWHMKSDVVAHPFHIHVNPFQIVAILDPKGRDVSGFDIPDDAEGQVDTQFRGLKGVWKDTIFVKSGPGGNKAQGQYTVIARTRYQRYAGDFVLHCHILDHEDLGMMQHVRIWDPARPETRTAPVPGHAHH